MADNSGPRSGNGDEQFMILQMVQDGTISPDEGGRLLESFSRAARVAPPPASPAPSKSATIHIVVTNRKGEAEIDLNLPIALVEMGLTVASKFMPGKLVDVPDIKQIARSGFRGKLIDINHGTDRIEITIE